TFSRGFRCQLHTGVALLTEKQRRQTQRRLEKSWRRALVPPSELTVAEWAEANIVIPPGKSEKAGRLSLDHTPYLREVVNCLQDPNVRCVTLCFGSQVGKTTALIIVVLFVCAADPAPV